MAENNRSVKHREMEENTGAPKGGMRHSKQAVRRKSGRKTLNLFDVLVIVLVLAVAVLLAFGISMGDLFGIDEKESRRLSYTLTLYDVDEAYADAIRQGDALYDVDTGALMGEVTQTPTVKQHTKVVLKTADDGTANAVEIPVPGRVNITVAVRGEVDYRAGEGYSIEGHDIRVGMTYAVRFPNYLGNAGCVSFDGVSAIRN